MEYYFEQSKAHYAIAIFFLCFWGFMGITVFSEWVYPLEFGGFTSENENYNFNIGGFIIWIVCGFLSFIFFIQVWPGMTD